MPLLDPRTLGSVVKIPRAVVVTGLRSSVTAIKWYDRQVFGLLRSRLEQSGPLALGAGPSTPTESLGERMTGLLERALENNPQASRGDLFHVMLDQLTPDEARIVGALSDGHSSPLIHVHSWSRTGSLGEAVLENASLIGKMANVTLPHLTPQYVTHLMSLGLLEAGPELAPLKEEYQILSADTGVLRATKRAARGPLAARIDKQSVRLSPLGVEFWRACFPESATP